MSYIELDNYTNTIMLDELDIKYNQCINILSNLLALNTSIINNNISSSLEHLMTSSLGDIDYTTEALRDKIVKVYKQAIYLIRKMINLVRDFVHKHFSKSSRTLKLLIKRKITLLNNLILEGTPNEPIYSAKQLQINIDILDAIDIKTGNASEFNWLKLAENGLGLPELGIVLDLKITKTLDVSKAKQVMSNSKTFNELGYTDKTETITLISKFIDAYKSYLDGYTLTKLEATINSHEANLKTLELDSGYSPLMKEGIELAKSNVHTLKLQIKLISTLLDLGSITVLNFKYKE